MGVIPKGTKINEVICGDDLVTVDFSNSVKKFVFPKMNGDDHSSPPVIPINHLNQ